jgi:phenylacetate-CoA ligase
MYKHSIKSVPYYQNNNYSHSFDSIENLAELPILRKKDLIKHCNRLVDNKAKVLLLQKIHTSGTTGTPLKIYFSREDIQKRYAFFEMRAIRWGGVDPGTPFAKVGGQLIVPFNQSKPPFWVWNSALNQLYMSSYHLSEKYGKYYLEELNRRKLFSIHGYASSLYTLAYYANNFGIDTIKFKTAFNTAEPFYLHQRELIEEVFNCRTHDHYTSSEYACLATECVEGNLHISPEVGIIEVLDENNIPVKIGEVGNLVLTGLLNYTMPLIRYDIGDVGSISYEKCNCGCQFPLLKNLEGRKDDLLITKDGRRIGRLGPVFRGDINIKEAQIIQISLESICVKIVPGKDYSVQDGKTIIKRLKERMGELNVEIELVDEIERTGRGKFRAVINRILHNSQAQQTGSQGKNVVNKY